MTNTSLQSYKLSRARPIAEIGQLVELEVGWWGLPCENSSENWLIEMDPTKTIGIVVNRHYANTTNEVYYQMLVGNRTYYVYDTWLVSVLAGI